MRLANLIVMAFAGTLVACINHVNVQCGQDSDCNLSGGGACTAAAGTTDRWCAYPDSGCPTGYRYSTLDVGDGVSGMCVAGTDAGVDAGIDAVGDTTCKLRVAFVDGKPPSFGLEDDSSGQGEVWIANPDGSGLVNLSNNATADDAHPSWSPDGLKVAFASNRSNTVGHYQIFVVSVDGTGLTNLTPSLAGASRPAWSPDGSRIAFTLGGNIWTMNADGSGVAQLTTLSAGTVANIVAWSPDGRQLLFSQSPQNGVIVRTLYVVRIGTGGQPLKLNTGNADEFGDGWAPFPRIVFDNEHNVFTVNSDGSGIVNVTQNADPAVAISGAVVTKKGNAIVFSRSRVDDSRHFDLWSVPSVGGVASQVTNTDGTRNSDFVSSTSSDGNTISLSRITDTTQGVVTSQIGTVGSDGSGLHLFNALGGSHAREVRLSTAVCQ